MVSGSTQESLDLDQHWLDSRIRAQKLKTLNQGYTLEISNLKRFLAQLQNRVHGLETSLEQKGFEFEKAQSQNIMLLEKVKKLENNNNCILKELNDEKAEHLKTKSSLSKTLLDLENQVSTLKSNMKITNDCLLSETRKKEGIIMSLVFDLEISKERVNELEVKLKDKEQSTKIQDIDHTTSASKEQNEQLKEELNHVYKQTEEQLLHIAVLEKKLDFARGSIDKLLKGKENYEIVFEKFQSLQREILNFQALCTRIDELEKEHNELYNREQIDPSTFFLQNQHGAKLTMHDLSNIIEKERLEHILTRQEMGRLCVQVNTKDLKIGLLENELAEMKKIYKERCEMYEASQLCVKRMEKSRRLIQRDVQFLKEQLSLQDNTIIPGGSLNQQNEKRIIFLEDLNQKYQERITELESELSGKNVEVAFECHHKYPFETVPPSLGEKIDKFVEESNERIIKTNKEISELRAENLTLKEKLEQSERHIKSKALDPLKTRVVQLINNPEEIVPRENEEELNNLRMENRALISELLEIDKLYNRSEIPLDRVCIPAASYKRLESQIDSLNNELSSKAKQIKSLEEIYRLRDQEYREAVLQYLGYKLEIDQNKRIQIEAARILNQHSDITIVFTPTQDSMPRLEVLGASEILQKQIMGVSSHYMGRMKSIPSFLAAVTLGLSNI